MTLAEVIKQIVAERSRQEELCAAGRFKATCASRELADEVKLAVIVEEIGEVARAVMEKSGAAKDRHNVELRNELIQVAACCVAWCEAIDE